MVDHGPPKATLKLDRTLLEIGLIYGRDMGHMSMAMAKNSSMNTYYGYIVLNYVWIL